jgi:hypothetical protein
LDAFCPAFKSYSTTAATNCNYASNFFSLFSLTPIPQPHTISSF